MASVESVPLGNKVNVSRTALLPLTSRVAPGAVVLIPIWELFWKIKELTMSLVPSHRGTKSNVPLPVTAGFTGGGAFLVPEAAGAAFVPFAIAGVLLANTNAEGGRPP